MTSRAGYWIGGVLIATGVVGALLWGVLGFLSMGDTVDGFVRAPAPGSATAQLEARKYIVYVEGPGVGRDFAPPVQFQVIDAATDRPLPVAGYGGSLTYSMSGHSGRAAGTVTPVNAGTHRLRAFTEDSSAAFNIALGESIGGRIVRTILGAFAIGGGLLAAGVGLIVTTSVRRRRRGAAGPPGAPPAPPPPSPSAHSGLAGLDG